MAGYKFYHYDPSFAAAVVFVLLFAVVTIRHIQLLFKKKTWYFIPFVIGCLFETIGYIGRCMSAKETPNWTLNPYLMQNLLLLLGPTFFAASIYMILGRLIRLLDADSYSLIRTTWLTKFFLLGDVLSFLSQSGGGGILATAKTADAINMGNNIILAGLGIQVVFFAFFMIVTVIFHIRIIRNPTTKSFSTTAPWKSLIWILYFTSLLIMVRSLFRMVEYAQGSDGSLMQKEMYVYLLDATLMFIVAAVFAVRHPDEVLGVYTSLNKGVGSSNTLENYPMVR